MNWDDPAERARLIDRVGPDEYNKLHGEHMQRSIVATVNGHDIRPVMSRFGRLFNVGKTGNAFATLAQAKNYASSIGKGD